MTGFVLILPPRCPHPPLEMFVAPATMPDDSGAGGYWQCYCVACAACMSAVTRGYRTEEEAYVELRAFQDPWRLGIDRNAAFRAR